MVDVTEPKGPKADKKLFNGNPFDSLLPLDPRIRIIGVDTDKKEAIEHPLYDPRAFLPPDPMLVKSMQEHGFLRYKPIGVVKDGEFYNVCDGRRRLTAAREAAKTDPTMVAHFVLIQTTDDVAMMGAMIIANELTVADDYFAKAAKARRVLDKVGEDAKGLEICAGFFGVDPMTIRGWLKLNGATDEVREAVAQGKLSMSAAQEIADMDRGEQRKFLRENVGKITFADAKRASKANKVPPAAGAPAGTGAAAIPGKKVSKVWRRQAIRDIVDAAKGVPGINADFILAFRAALGEVNNVDLPPSVQKLIADKKIKLTDDI